ncbi:killer cell lectin-like receptor subfamily G member 2 [Pleurodeles waltl]|uniref:killer cell lectin-like receptor subfamily G member 2 n=1 Tax=Pleurodeles waltl TaxID=8319 RepID=UPI003709739C
MENGTEGTQLTPLKGPGDHDDSGIASSPDQTPNGQTPLPRCNCVLTPTKTPHAVPNPLENILVRPEEESLRSSEERDGHQATPRNKCPWLQDRRIPTVSWHRELQLRTSLVPCPKDWIWTNGACYFFSIEKKSWNKSNEFCTSHDGTLAIILDQYTLDTIKRYKTIDNSWIGLLRRDGVWLWVNGTLFSGSLLPMAEDVPNLHCAYLNEDKYGILDCASLRNWICIRNSSSSMAELPALG